MTAPASRSGLQYEISLGDQSATITDIGAKVRRYAVDGRDVFTPFGADEVAPAAHGAVLAPWPNRLRDGRYRLGETEYQLDISEPPTNTAIHGLVMWQRWQALEVTASGVVLELRLAPSPGYPFELLLRLGYRLGSDGLHVDAAARNLGAEPAPYGIGFHPWLSPGTGNLDECTFQLDAATRVRTDDRLLPVGTEPASGRYDLRAGQPVRGLDLDDAYLDVERTDGLSWARLRGPDGATAAVWMGEAFAAWQVCTGDHITAAHRRTGVAAEPMTCIADAFRTGDLLVMLAPGQSHEVSWGAGLR